MKIEYELKEEEIRAIIEQKVNERINEYMPNATQYFLNLHRKGIYDYILRHSGIMADEKIAEQLVDRLYKEYTEGAWRSEFQKLLERSLRQVFSPIAKEYTPQFVNEAMEERIVEQAAKQLAKKALPEITKLIMSLCSTIIDGETEKENENA